MLRNVNGSLSTYTCHVQVLQPVWLQLLVGLGEWHLVVRSMLTDRQDGNNQKGKWMVRNMKTGMQTGRQTDVRMDGRTESPSL
jgi:hypothetical protein